MHVDVRFARGQGNLNSFCTRLFDVCDISEALILQQLLGNVLGRMADARNLDESEPSGLRRRVGVSRREIVAEQRSGAGQRTEPPQELTARAMRLHVSTPLAQ